MAKFNDAIREAATHTLSESIEEASRNVGRDLASKPAVRTILRNFFGSRLETLVRQVPAQFAGAVISAAIGLANIKPETKAILRQVFPYLVDGLLSGAIDVASWEQHMENRLHDVVSDDPDAANPEAKLDTVAVSSELPHVHLVILNDQNNIVGVGCSIWEAAKAKWNAVEAERARNQPRQVAGRGAPPPPPPAVARPFPEELVTLERGLAMKSTDCPVCMGGLYARERQAAAKSVVPEAWEDKLSETGLWLARALAHSVDESDYVDEMNRMNVRQWEQMAIHLAIRLLNIRPVETLTFEQVALLERQHRRLPDDEVENLIRVIFGANKGKLDFDTKIKGAAKGVLGWLQGKYGTVPGVDWSKVKKAWPWVRNWAIVELVLVVAFFGTAWFWPKYGQAAWILLVLTPVLCLWTNLGKLPESIWNTLATLWPRLENMRVWLMTSLVYGFASYGMVMGIYLILSGMLAHEFRCPTEVETSWIMKSLISRETLEVGRYIGAVILMFPAIIASGLAKKFALSGPMRLDALVLTKRSFRVRDWGIVAVFVVLLGGGVVWNIWAKDEVQDFVCRDRTKVEKTEKAAAVATTGSSYLDREILCAEDGLKIPELRAAAGCE